jgi:DNA-binding transcriptional ArsR family regulator
MPVAPSPKRGNRPRARIASGALGPVGHLFGSPHTARVLDLLTTQPHGRFTLGDIVAYAGGAKGTVQSSLRCLERANLVRREGRGSRTAYRYAGEHEIAQRMLGVVEASRRAVGPPAKSAIPWLERFLRDTPRDPVQNPFGGRVERLPSEEGTAQILSVAEPAEEARRPGRPGLVTRR